MTSQVRSMTIEMQKMPLGPATGPLCTISMHIMLLYDRLNYFGRLHSIFLIPWSRKEKYLRHWRSELTTFRSNGRPRTAELPFLYAILRIKLSLNGQQLVHVCRVKILSPVWSMPRKVAEVMPILDCEYNYIGRFTRCRYWYIVG